ncbi:MAG: UDP-N-acetylmuramate dehydrogenase [Acidobacteriota bacterium]
MLLEENKPLAPYTTLGIGGPARWFVRAVCDSDVVEAAHWAREHGAPVFVLGGGSNLLVSDRGFDGLVIQVALEGISEQDVGRDTVLFRVAAGEDWNRFVQRAVDENCAGIECLAGIPGTVGGTPVQNVGAYGQEVAPVIGRVCAYDLRDGGVVEFGREQCGFAYRRSRFNTTDRGRYVALRVDFQLRRGGAPELRYADLQRVFAPDAKPTLAEVADAVRQIRQRKGMLLVDGDPDCRSAGSFFKNPVVAVRDAERISAAAHADVPQFPCGVDGMVKVSAAWLIEHAGFAKGFALGAAAVSSRHTLALVNRGGATALDVLSLADRIRNTVQDRFGVALELEPVMVGFGESR